MGITVRLPVLSAFSGGMRECIPQNDTFESGESPAHDSANADSQKTVLRHLRKIQHETFAVFPAEAGVCD